jgi:FtsH-binding integral membrane protein
MATASKVTAQPAARLHGRRFDHLFFASMIVLMLGTVFLGFARTYFLAGVVRAPLPSTIIHIHGAIFSCWMLLVLTQTTLVSAHRVDIHRKLGLAGFGLACLMVVMGVLATADELRRTGSMPGPPDMKAFAIVPITSILMFAVFIALAYRARKDSPLHKRLVLLAMTDMMVAAIARWPFDFVYRNVGRAALISCLVIVALALYDLWSTHKIHRATLWGGLAIILVQQSRETIGATGAWHAFASWMQSWGV